MDFPERFSNLPDYAFPRLRKLLDHHAPGGEVVHMTIGEPMHAAPAFVGEIIQKHLATFNKYPPNEGTPELLSAISGWLARRYGVAVAEERICNLNGTREGLFNALVALCPETKNGQRPAVLMPNPFYQVYAVASLSVGAEPVFLPAGPETGFLPDLSALSPVLLDRTAVVYLCSPANPQGAVASEGYWAELMRLAEKHDFRIFADECYSEIWKDAAPPGALAVAAKTGTDPERVMIFNSLSKRSNLAGLRSGFCAGGPQAIAKVRQLRSYAGAPVPGPLQRVSEAAWSDEAHVEANRAAYVQKYLAAAEVFGGMQGFRLPEGGFFLWLPVRDGEEAALKVWQQTGVRVLPGAYLARDVNGQNPGRGYIRVAMVAPTEELTRGLIRLRDCLFA